jgi:nucleoside-diphosphate-sugar epimerase
LEFGAWDFNSPFRNSRRVTIRISTSVLQEKRENRSLTVLLTGATGFLGSHIAAEMIRRGIPLWVICRPNQHITGRERFNRILDWLGVKPRDPSRVRVLEGFLDRPNLGLNQNQEGEIRDHVDEIIHCSSNTSFAERRRPEVEKDNITGLRNLLDWAARSRCYFFHHLSTAYVAGKREGVCREAPVEAGAFTNVYEESKCRGEQMVVERCSREGIRWGIYRPSIVYGDSRTGKSLSFRALYYPVRTVLYFKNLYRTDMLEQNGRRAKEMGVRMEADGTIRLPLRLEVNAEGGINLIPIDFFLQAFMAVWEDSPEGGIFHLVNPRPKRIEDLIEYTQRLFRITGIRAVSGDDFQKTPRNPLEILLETFLEAYQPYIRDQRVFDCRKTEPILQRRQILCPDFDFEIFSRCMNYAVAAGWGTKI